MSWDELINTRLASHRQSDKWRKRLEFSNNNERQIIQDGKHYYQFSSNDYLGLRNHRAVVTAWQKGAEMAGVGAGASAYVTGYSKYHSMLEEQLADWLNYPRALLFISGFSANQAAIHLLAEKNDRILADKLAHASILDAAAHSPAQLRRFSHNKTGSLVKLLSSPCEARTLVITEGIFSMDGDSAPLADIARQTQQAKAWLMVDDAHGIGIRGEEGRGSCWQQGIKPDILVITFGKAFGLSGAAILCNQTTAEYFEQFSRHLIYSTAMPPAQCNALLTSLTLIRQGEDLRERLKKNITRFKIGASQLPWPLIESDSPIQPLLLGDNNSAITLSKCLADSGFWVSAIRPPTVPPGTARLRITLSAEHSDDDIDRLLEALHDNASK